MITHDVDEAILLADKIMLMSSNTSTGPAARIAEVVVNTLPKTRTRADIHHHPQFYKIRNHLVDFLVNRSNAAAVVNNIAGLDYPPEVLPGLTSEDESSDIPLKPSLKKIK